MAKTYKPVSHKVIEVDGRKVIVRCYAPHNAYAGSNTWERKGSMLVGSLGTKGFVSLQAFQPKHDGNTSKVLPQK